MLLLHHEKQYIGSRLMARASQAGADDVSSALICMVGIVRYQMDRTLASHPTMREQPSGSNLQELM